METKVSDRYLRECRLYKTPVQIYMKNGICLKGFIQDYDDVGIILVTGKQEILISRYATASVVPA